MNSFHLGILIIGYKNVIGIKRLLSSLEKVNFYDDKDIKLIFSIDYSGSDDVFKIANDYIWKYGKKIIINIEHNLGLRKHIFSCGDYLNKYDLDAMAVLEDDVYLSPCMYSYFKESVKFYSNDENIAGISLYKHEIDILGKQTFIDLQDGGDTYFMQYAQSWGQIWLKEAWNNFYKWYLNEEYKNINIKEIPDNIQKWKNSWLKYHILYCIAKNKYFVYPRISLTTNFSDIGTHSINSSSKYQVALFTNSKKDWNFNTLSTTSAIYDAFFQNISIKSILKYNSLLIDLNGTRKYDGYDYVITLKKVNYKIIKTWGLELRPIELNIIYNIDGNDIILYDLRFKKNNSTTYNYYKIIGYNLKGVNVFSFYFLKYYLIKIYKHIKSKITKRILRIINSYTM